MVAGSVPQNADEVNSPVGSICRQFILLEQQVSRFNTFLGTVSLQGAPYNMSSGDEANIKSAIGGLNTALSAVDTTFVNRLTGLF